MVRKVNPLALLTMPSSAIKNFMQSGETIKLHMKNNTIEELPELAEFINDLHLREPEFLMTLTGKNDGLNGYVNLSEARGKNLLHGIGTLSFDSKPMANFDIIIGQNVGEIPAFKLNASYKMQDGFDVRNAELRFSTDSDSLAYDIKGSLSSNGNEIEFAANTKKLDELNKKTGIMDKLLGEDSFRSFGQIFDFIDNRINKPLVNFTQEVLEGYKNI